MMLVLGRTLVRHIRGEYGYRSLFVRLVFVRKIMIIRLSMIMGIRNRRLWDMLILRAGVLLVTRIFASVGRFCL